MPYDINQLNDLLLPELQDVATRLRIADTAGLDKQHLIYKIIDQQALVAAKGARITPKQMSITADGEAPKKKRGRPAKQKTRCPRCRMPVSPCPQRKPAQKQKNRRKSAAARRRKTLRQPATPDDAGSRPKCREQAPKWAQLSRNQEDGQCTNHSRCTARGYRRRKRADDANNQRNCCAGTRR